MRRLLPLALLAAVLPIAPAAAAVVACPLTNGVHPLARTAAASLYVGDPARRVERLPTQLSRSTIEPNVWVLDGNELLTLVCRYEGTREALVAPVPLTVRMCIQDFVANTMVCR